MTKSPQIKNSDEKYLSLHAIRDQSRKYSLSKEKTNLEDLGIVIYRILGQKRYLLYNFNELLMIPFLLC
jgi:hypothetical protein